MNRRSIRHGAVVQCDMPECRETFTTYCVAGLARKQAAAVGWSRVAASSVEHGGHRLGTGKQKVDVCPGCKPAPRMERGASP